MSCALSEFRRAWLSRILILSTLFEIFHNLTLVQLYNCSILSSLVIDVLRGCYIHRVFFSHYISPTILNLNFITYINKSCKGLFHKKILRNSKVRYKTEEGGRKYRPNRFANVTVAEKVGVTKILSQ